MSPTPHTYAGIDFSGDRTQWKPNAQSSNVWVAVAEDHDPVLSLLSLRRVQELPGPGRPFPRLAAWLAAGGFSAAAIDGPFSVPWWLFGPSRPDHTDLLAAVDGLGLKAGHDFPTGREFVACTATGIPFPFTKPLRQTECYWRGRGVNTRSTMWTGARPGAPFASACLKLLATAARPIWPWAGPDRVPLVEAFPAAQLRQWGVPFAEYNGALGRANRAVIVGDLIATRGLRVGDEFRAAIEADADALDAVISCYAARAVVRGRLGVPLPPFEAWRLEGWIAVHD